MAGLWDRLASLWQGRTIEESALEPTGLVPAVAVEAVQRDLDKAQAYLRQIQGGQLHATWRLDRPVYTDWSTATAIKSGLKASTWVYICVTLIAESMASVPLRVQVQASDGSWSWSDLRAPNAALLQALIDDFNPFMPRSIGLALAAKYWLLGGEGYLLKNRGLDDDDPPLELWPQHGDQLRPIASERDWIRAYEHWVGGQLRPEQPTRDVVPFVSPDPANPTRGLSPLKAGGKTVDSDAAAAQFQTSSLQNMAIPSGIYSTKELLTIEQFEDAKQKFDNRHVGASKGRGVMFMDGGTSFTPVSITPKELDFINTRKATAYEICALFRVPPPVIGLYEHATYNNVSSAYRSFWKDTVMTALGLFVGVFNNCLVPDFQAEGQPAIRLWPDTSGIEILNIVTPEMADVVRKLHGVGVPLIELNRRFGLNLKLEGVAGADRAWVSRDRQLLGADGEPVSSKTSPPIRRVK